MSVRLICLILMVVVVVTSSSTVEAEMYIGELPKHGIHYFKVDEVPNNITVYWDYEENRVVDDIYVCPMVASGKMDCSKAKHADKDTYIFTTCPSPSPVAFVDAFYYITSRQCWVCNSCLMWLIPDKVIHPRAITKSNVKECSTWETNNWKLD
jgi:hypothetical protein